MAYTLSGGGHIDFSPYAAVMIAAVTTVPPNSGIGNANPTERFQVGMLRFTDGTGYDAGFAFRGGPQRIVIPLWATGYDYWIAPLGVVTITEEPGVRPAS